jgi:hypothetical protein
VGDVVDVVDGVEDRIAVHFVVTRFEDRFGYHNSVAWAGEGEVDRVKSDWDLGEAVEVPSWHMDPHHKYEGIAAS